MRLVLSGVVVALASVFSLSTLAAAELERVRVSDDGKSFVLEPSGKPFTVWGVNYDHDSQGRLIEDYWIDEWDTVVGDFEEMKALGVNVVRVHLQFSKFMDSFDKPNKQSLEQLSKLVALCERLGLYLDLTGLACYHKWEVHPWYDNLSDKRRWKAQANFWEAVAKQCAGSPAIFCYDLMNEPVVGGKRDDWLGQALGNKTFVQFIGREAIKKPRHEVAKAWIRQLKAAVRKHDKETMITVGLVDWSLDRPGMQSGFVPERIIDELDFVAVHVYPETGKVDEAIDTLKGFDLGKPIVIEETYSYKCGLDDFIEFVDRSRPIAEGWIGFYWGTPLEELDPPKDFGQAIQKIWLEYFKANAPQ